jgi:hypothetical protein
MTDILKELQEMIESPSYFDDKWAHDNVKLKDALSGLIPWAGELPSGPRWATQEAKERNREMFSIALENACACFESR